MIRKFLRIFTMVCFLGAAVVGCEIDEEEAEEGSKDAPVELTVDTWTNGEIANAGDEQWFNFVATASTQRVYVKFNTLTRMRVYLYDDGFNQMGDRLDASGNVSYVNYFEKSLTKGKTYHIKVTGQYNNDTGNYWIGFTAFPAQPETVITKLTENKWANGNIVSSSSGGTGEQWFSFVATAATQYISVRFSTCTSFDVYLYDSNYNQIGVRWDADGSSSGTVKKTSWALNSGEIYYIKADYGAGTYWIGFTAFPAQPETVITKLSSNSWANGNITKQVDGGTGEQWFSFVATAATQYFYVKFSTGTSFDVYMYDSNYNQIGSRWDADGSSGAVKKTSWALNFGETYYIKADYGTGTYWLTFNSTGEAPQ